MVLGLILIGGLGIVTLARVLLVLFTSRLGMRTRAFAQAETKALSAAHLRRLVRRIVVFSLELLRNWRRPGRWSVLTQITVTVTAVLLPVGTLVILAAEATTPRRSSRWTAAVGC